MNVTKTYDELTFADDFMFCQIMADNPELCRKVIELILQQPIKRVVVSKQHEKKYRNDRHGIRLDVYADDTAGSVYDIEMQTSASTPIPMRSRYYQSMIDTGYLRSGKSYDSLPKSYIIFICTFDFFKRGLPVYTFVNTCLEDPGACYDDKTVKIVLNSDSHGVETDEHLRNFLDYIASGEAKDDLTREIDENIATAKDNEEWREEYMSFDIILKENMDIARAEGKSIGEAFGIIRSERRHNSTDKEIQNILMAELNVDSKKAMELIADYNNSEK